MMKNYILIFILGCVFANSDTLWVDKGSSDVQWIGRKVTGQHNGHIQVAGGFIVKNKGKLESGEILMNMQSITVDDIENPKWNQKLVTHLKDDDFFNSGKYPTAKFVFNKVTNCARPLIMPR